MPRECPLTASIRVSHIRRIARELDLPDDYFREVREAFVIDRIKRDGALRDSLYKRLRRRG